MQSALRPVSIAALRYSITCRVRVFSTTAVQRSLDLAFDYHAPPDSGASSKNAPIVFLHGLFGSKKNNRSIIVRRALARRLSRPVYAIDLRNHGSSPHDPTHNYTSLAEDVEGFIKKHELRAPTLIGHSMGAKTAMTVALRSPSLVANLIPVDNAPVDAALKSDFGTYVKGMRKVEEAQVKRQSEADEILKPFVEELSIRQFLLTNLIRSPDGTHLQFRIPLKYLSSCLDDMADFPFTNPDEVRFEKPALFVRGTKSPYVADETLPIIGRFFPRFELVDIDAGHWVISENPNAFQEAVVEFLERVSS